MNNVNTNMNDITITDVTITDYYINARIFYKKSNKNPMFGHKVKQIYDLYNKDDNIEFNSFNIVLADSFGRFCAENKVNASFEVLEKFLSSTLVDALII